MLKGVWSLTKGIFHVGAIDGTPVYCGKNSSMLRRQVFMRFRCQGSFWFLERRKDSIIQGQGLGFLRHLGEERKVHGGMPLHGR